MAPFRLSFPVVASLYRRTMAGQVCSACATENPAGARFCMSCGTALPRRCTGCGEPIPDEARFCPACGTEQDRRSVPRPAAPA
ncbi:MAG: hypothetical protein QOJ97_2760, partial [Solirubrobacteraceae bacterium]|nr:hypothetical protein [Solirubrobacteraceae bacterium]